MTTAGLCATDVWLARGDRTVLAGAAVEIPRGQVTALIAPSGAGKSTLLRCLTRLLDPDRGSITLGGKQVRELAPRELRRRVGLVAQHPVMLEGSVTDNLRYGLLPAPDADAVAQALRSSGLDIEFAGRLAADLSGGEQARVAIARAIIRGPEFLLFDEPTAALDDETAAQLGATFRSLATDGLGLCVATHDRAFAARYADQIVHLDGSKDGAA